MFTKIKSISIGTIYKPLNKIRFLEQTIEKLELLYLNDEHYPLGDYILDKPNETKKFHIDLSPIKGKYSDCCTTY